MLAISLLVLLHEGGHFFFSKLFGVRVEKFYLFFDWKFSLFKFKPKNSDTEYGIGWIPLGGYCKIAGMIDESFDTEQMKQPVQNYEFRAKPSWQVSATATSSSAPIPRPSKTSPPTSTATSPRLIVSISSATVSP